MYLPAAVPPIGGDDPLLAFVGVIEDDDAPSDLASELVHYGAFIALPSHRGVPSAFRRSFVSEIDTNERQNALAAAAGPAAAAATPGGGG